MANATSMEAGQPTDHLQQVRRLLRQKEYRRAVETIDRRLVGVTNVTSRVAVEDVRTYAYERLGRIGPGPHPGRWNPVSLRRGVQVSLRRPVAVDLRRLDRPTLERVLRWLFAGELRAAQDALHHADPAAAATAAEFAARIDDRSTSVALLHAFALHGLVTAALRNPAADLDEIDGRLQRADRLAARVAADPTLRDPYKRLVAALDEVSDVVDRRRESTGRTEGVNALVRRFNLLARHYNDADQTISHVQVGNARASLAQISAEVDRQIRKYPPESTAGQVLADLRSQCVRYRGYLERRARAAVRD
jgi:hypothetical protein